MTISEEFSRTERSQPSPPGGPPLACVGPWPPEVPLPRSPLSCSEGSKSSSLPLRYRRRVYRRAVCKVYPAALADLTSQSALRFSTTPCLWASSSHAFWKSHPPGYKDLDDAVWEVALISGLGSLAIVVLRVLFIVSITIE